MLSYNENIKVKLSFDLRKFSLTYNELLLSILIKILKNSSEISLDKF